MNFDACQDVNGMKAFADSMFTVLREKGIKNLVIDVRYNGGGNSNVGDVISFKLPNSRLAVNVSHKRFWLPGADDNDIHGVIPDIICPQDEALNAALECIKVN